MNYFATMVAFFLLPLVMVICGMSYTKKAPKRISKLSGYRTKMSMKNRETWDFAHKYLGDLWFKLGAPLLAVTSVVSLVVFRENDKKILFWCYVIVAIQLVIMITPIYFTEKALKANFDENGKWRKEAKEKWKALEAKKQETEKQVEQKQDTKEKTN